MNFTEHKEINNLLGTLLLKIKSVLGHNIKGAYLYGSLVWGDFDYVISDIDLLVITQNDINKKEFADLNDAHQALLKKSFIKLVLFLLASRLFKSRGRFSFLHGLCIASKNNNWYKKF